MLEFDFLLNLMPADSESRRSKCQWRACKPDVVLYHSCYILPGYYTRHTYK